MARGLSLDYSGLFWILNGRITEEGAQQQMRAFRSAGFTSVLPAPICDGTAGRRESAWQNSGMHCDYLSEEFFRQYAHIVRACRDNGLALWVWDDDFCPAGWAGGAMLRARPDLRGKLVHRMETSAETPPGTVRTLLERDGLKYVLASEPPNATRVDVFHPDAGPLFVSLNYEQYLKRFPGSIGDTIVGFFIDEPGIPGCIGGRYRVRDGFLPMPLPWTDDLPALWNAAYGGNLVDLLPLLFMDSDDSAQARETRARFGELINRLWVERWMLPARDWCRRQGLIYTGHLNNDDYVEARLKSSGNLPNSLRFFDMPGVDVVVHHVLPDKERQPDEGRSVWDVNDFNGDFIRIASSAARSSRTGRAMCELGDAYGLGEDMEMRKWLLDYHLARGIDLIFWGAPQYSMSGADVMATAGHLGAEQPYWPFWTQINEYVRNIVGMLDTGKRCASAAIFYPAAGYMSAAGERLNEKLDALATFLRGHGVDFDYLEMWSDAGIRYDQVFVPAASPVSAEEVAFLARKASECAVFAPADLKVSGATAYVAPGAAHRRGEFMKYAQDMYGSLAGHLRPDVALSGLHEASIHKREVRPGEFLLFVFNESAGQRLSFVPRRASGHAAFLYAPEMDAFYSSDGGEVSLAPGESLLVFTGRHATIAGALGKSVQQPPPAPRRTVTLRPNEGEFRSAVEYRWNGREVERVNIGEAEYQARGGDFSGEVVRRLGMTVEGECEDIEVVVPAFRGAIAVSVNGKSVGSILWPPKKLRVSGKLLKPGENNLELVLCNTLANHLRSADFLNRLESMGIAQNVYFRMTEAFDRRAIADDGVCAGKPAT